MYREESNKKGYSWKEPENKEYTPTVKSVDLPDKLSDATDDIMKEIIACPNKGRIESKCTFAYRIVPDELRFYRLMNIPIPRYCPNCRYYERRKWKNPWKLWHRRCMCNKNNHAHKSRCSNEFKTSYAPERPEIIYCEKCYQAEVY